MERHVHCWWNFVYNYRQPFFDRIPAGCKDNLVAGARTAVVAPSTTEDFQLRKLSSTGNWNCNMLTDTICTIDLLSTFLCT